MIPKTVTSRNSSGKWRDAISLETDSVSVSVPTHSQHSHGKDLTALQDELEDHSSVESFVPDSADGNTHQIFTDNQVTRKVATGVEQA